jgi:hypothetical protein
MLYKGYWINCLELCPAYDPDGGFNPLFVIRKRHSQEILAQARSISQALEVIRELIQAEARQMALGLA